MFRPRNSTQVKYVVLMRAHFKNLRNKIDTQVWSIKMLGVFQKPTFYHLFPGKLLGPVVDATFMELNEGVIKFLVPIAVTKSFTGFYSWPNNVLYRHSILQVEILENSCELSHKVVKSSELIREGVSLIL